MLGYFQQVNLKGNQRKQKYGKFTFLLYCHILCGLTLRPQSCRCTLDHIHKFPIRSYWQASSGTSWCFHRFTYSWGLSWCWHWCTLNDIHKFPIRSYWQASFGTSWCFHRFTYNWGLSWGLQQCCLDGWCRHRCG